MMKQFKTIAENIRRRFIEEGEINIIGATVNSPEELAELLQIYKNPDYETFRFIYMKENKIVGIEGATIRLPHLSFSYDQKLTSKEYLERVKSRMQDLGADGYYITHNHPSGDITPSLHDEMTTHRYATGISGFLGHIITDHTECSFLTRGVPKKLPISKKHQIEIFHKNVGQSDLLNIEIKKPEDMANIAKLLDEGKGTSLVVFFDSNKTIKRVDEIPNGKVGTKSFEEYLEDALVGKGLASAYCLTNEESVYNETGILIENRYLSNCILVRNNEYISALSWARKSNKVDFAGKTYEEFPCFSFYETTPADKDVKQEIMNIKEQVAVRNATDVIISKGIIETTTRSWIARYEDVASYMSYDQYVEKLKEIESELYRRDEVMDVEIVDDELDIIYKAGYCVNLVDTDTLQPEFKCTEPEFYKNDSIEHKKVKECNEVVLEK